MSEDHGNPCVECIKSSKHGCCALKGACGLMLTNDEYDRHFKAHAEGLEIRQSKKFHIISSKEGLICPHFENGACGIYHDRPLDCRLYPYVMRRFIERGRKVKIVFHSKSDCPDKPALFRLMQEAAAKELVVAFGKKVYGENACVSARHEKGLFSRLIYRAETMVSRYFWGRRKNEAG